MSRSFFFFFFLFWLATHPLGIDEDFDFVVWDVGQGSWMTWIHSDQCFHFDMGGEKYPSPVHKICGQRMNHVYLTHLDRDHINFLRRFMFRTARLCLYYPKQLKKLWMKKVDTCGFPPKQIRRISLGMKDNHSNEGSIIYLIAKKVLVTGDAPISQELKWYRKTPRGLRILILGHHGSKTSSSVKLLDWLRPEIALVSARKGKYGHPHPKVVRKLKARKIPLLKTETLGHIFFKL